jgi:thiol peroxidase
MKENVGGVTIKGNSLTTLGKHVNVGEKAPDFLLVKNNMQPVSLADSAGKVRLISVVPSLDTGICHAQTKRFNDEALNYAGVEFLTVSAEHPFNQKRWCEQESCSNIAVVSDHMAMQFGQDYGLAIKEWRLLQRAIIIIDADDTVAYTEYIPEIAQFPDYDAALVKLEELVG